MLCAILSDIHGNREALGAVMARIAALHVSVVYCLGDFVGYNADPDDCVLPVLGRATAAVRGNHDKAAAGLLSLEWFNAAARDAVLWTRRTASAETIAALKALPRGPVEVAEGVLLCHGTPMDEDAYMIDLDSIMESYRFLDERYSGFTVCFHGHTHQPLAVVRRRRARTPKVLRSGEEVALAGGEGWLINPGSVGQPRDGITAASFGIFNTDGGVYRNYRVAYDVRETQRKIRSARLPPQLAWRLAEGR
jgi:predicted phosphodiesterase